jgi:hypothetical protein
VRRTLALVSSAVVALSGCSLVYDLGGFAGPQPAADAGASEGGAVEAGPGDGGTEASGGDAASKSGYVKAVLDDAPVTYLRFEEKGGPTARDEMGHHDGLYQGAVDFASAGAIANDPTAKAMHLTGNPGSGVALGDVFDLAGNGPFTIELWFKADAVDGEFRRILWKSTMSGPSQGWWISFEQTFFVNMVVRRDDATTLTLSSGSVPLSTWTHIAITYDGVTTRLHRDGVLGRTAPSSTNALDTTEGLFVGALSNGYNPLRGSVDELAFYDKPLTTERIKAHFDASR